MKARSGRQAKVVQGNLVAFEAENQSGRGKNMKTMVTSAALQ
jgi:hypothetical protein